MDRPVYQINFAGHPLRISFLHPGTRYLLWPLPRRCEGTDYDIRVEQQQLEAIRAAFPPDSSDPYLEYRCLLGEVGRTLLRWHCCVFHAVAFMWRGRAWLLTAPPETGKSTQYFNWFRLHPEEITIISGDMPVIEQRDDGRVWVHPSAWNGKENIATLNSAPLGGLVLLEQGKENRMEPLSPREAIQPLMKQMMAIPGDEDEVRAVTSLLEALLRAVPCRKMINLGDDASTELLRQTWIRDLEKGDPAAAIE